MSDNGTIQTKMREEARCRACGGLSNLQAHHVIPRSLGGRNGPEAVVPLCNDCHRSWHDGRLDLLPLLTTSEQIEAVRVAKTIERAREIITRSRRTVSHTASER